MGKKVSLFKGDSWFLYSIMLSLGVLGFIIFKQPLFLIFGALLSVLMLVFKK